MARLATLKRGHIEQPKDVMRLRIPSARDLRQRGISLQSVSCVFKPAEQREFARIHHSLDARPQWDVASPAL
jgi:hypothetical protein